MQKIEKLIAEDENSKSRFHKSWYKADGNRKRKKNLIWISMYQKRFMRNIAKRTTPRIS